MRQRAGIRRRTDWLGRGAGLLVLLILIGGTAAALWGAGLFTPRQPSHEGLIACPAAARPLRAYDIVAKEDVIDGKSLELKVAWLSPATVEGSGIVREFSQIMGRVAAKDKSIGTVFTERDFLPKGTRPGVAAGIPPGKRALTIPAERVEGLELLRQGDAFDLVVALPPQAALDESNVEYATLLGGIKPPDTRAGHLAHQTGVRTLASEGTMVALMQGKTTSTSGRQGLTVPANARATKATEVHAVIAVTPEEVNRISEALGQDLKILCVAHSGHVENAAHRVREPSFAGMIPVPAPVKRLTAYTAITQDDLADAVSGKLNVYYFQPDKVSPDWKTDFTQLIGRVVRRDIEPGAVLTEGDLLPPGTRPGPSAGAPPGMVVIQVPSDRIQGLDGLARGDRFAIHAQLPQTVRPAFESVEWATIVGGQLSSDDLRLQQELRTGIRVVTDNAMLVVPIPNGSDLASSTCAIAIPEKEALSFRQFLQLNEPLTAVVRSNQMNEPSPVPKLEAHGGSGPLRHTPPNIQTVAWQHESADGDAPPGMIPFPVTARALKPFAKIRAEDFIDPATGKIRVFYFPQSKVKEAWIPEVSLLIDRVPTHEVDVGRVILESDLLPAGTRPGVVAGVSPEEVAISVDDRWLHGLKEARVGDFFTVLGARPFSPQSHFQNVRQPLAVDPKRDSPLGAGTLFDQASVTVLAENVRLISIGEPLMVEETRMATRVIPSSVEYQGDKIVRATSEATSLEPQAVSVTIQEYVIAVSPHHVASLEEAIATQTHMRAILRSSQPPLAESGAKPQYSPKISEKDPLQRGVAIEHIRGQTTTREFWLSSEKTDLVETSATRGSESP